MSFRHTGREPYTLFVVTAVAVVIDYINIISHTIPFTPVTHIPFFTPVIVFRAWSISISVCRRLRHVTIHCIREYAWRVAMRVAPFHHDVATPLRHSDRAILRLAQKKNTYCQQGESLRERAHAL